MWDGNKTQAATLESVMLDGAKRILGCSSKTCNEAVRGDMGLDTLQDRIYNIFLTRYILPFTPMIQSFNHKPSRQTIS